MYFRSDAGIATGLVLPIFVICAIILSAHTTYAQEYDLTYKLPEGTSLKYNRVVEENAYAELHSNLAAEVSKKKESFFSITGAGTGSDDACIMTYLQDTVFVEETPPAPDPKQALTINNIISNVPIRLTVSPKGKLLDAAAEQSILSLKGMKDQNFSERQIAAMAMFLPALPDREVGPESIWTAATKDTVVPFPDLGKRNSLRIQTVHITYHAEGMETIGDRECLKISWEGTSLLEEKHIEGGQERFVEEQTDTKGSYCFDVKESVLVSMEQKAKTEMTTAYYGKKSGIVPYTSSIHTIITLQE